MDLEAHNLIRIMVVAIAGFSILFGFLLFRIVTETQGSLRISGQNHKIELSDVAPGIYFSLFGSLVLFAVLWTQPYTEHTTSRQDSRGLTTTQTRSPASIDNEVMTPEFSSETCLKSNSIEHVENAISLTEYISNQKEVDRFLEIDDGVKSMLLEVLDKPIEGLNFHSFLDQNLTNEKAHLLIKSYLAAYVLNNSC